METLFEDYLDLLGNLHENCKLAIKGLSQDALDWKPNPSMNSICVLINHLVGAERYWIGDFIMKEPSGRDRNQEFQTNGFDSYELSQMLDDGLAYIQNSLGDLTVQELEDIQIMPGGGQKYTSGWAILHVLEHIALHLGHIEVTRHMWESRFDN